MSGALTHQEARVLTLVRDQLARTGLAPTHDELTRELGLSSKSHVHRLVVRLVEKKHLERVPYSRRGLRLPHGDQLSVTLPDVAHRALLARARETDRPAEALITDAVFAYLAVRR